MKIKCNENDLKNCCGVYIFKNLIDNKCYIGSTVMTFEKKNVASYISFTRK